MTMQGVYLIGHLTGTYQTIADVPTPTLMAGGRTLTVLFGVATLLLTYLSGCRLLGPVCGLSAALVVATSPLHISHSFVVGVDVPSAFWVTLTLWLSPGIYRGRHGLGHYLLCGAVIGLAMGTKYTAAACVVVLLAAHLAAVPFYAHRLLDRRLWLAMATAGVVFLLTHPMQCWTSTRLWALWQSSRPIIGVVMLA